MKSKRDIRLVDKARLASRQRKIEFSTGQRVGLAIISLAMAIYALSLVYPFIFLLLNSFRNEYDYIMYPTSFPTEWTLSNYIAVFKEYNMGEMFFNSVTLSLGETIASMFFTCCAAYVLAKFKFPGNGFIYSVVLVSGMLPTIASLPSTYKLMVDTKLFGTYIGMIILECGAFGGSFLYLHSYFKQISWSFAEAAEIDGASDFRIFFDIMLPLAKNGIITFTIIRFLGFWNDYWFPYLFYGEHPTLAVGLASLTNAADTQDAWVILFAAMVVAIIPVIIFYIIFQRKLMSNVTGGGIKE